MMMMMMMMILFASLTLVNNVIASTVSIGSLKILFNFYYCL